MKKPDTIDARRCWDSAPLEAGVELLPEPDGIVIEAADGCLRLTEEETRWLALALAEAGSPSSAEPASRPGVVAGPGLRLEDLGGGAFRAGLPPATDSLEAALLEVESALFSALSSARRAQIARRQLCADAPSSSK